MIHFGRYSDSYKGKDKIEKWNLSEQIYFEKKYIESYKNFLEYLGNDNLDNIKYSVDENKIIFEFYQGSKIIKGLIENDKIICEAEIAEFDKLSIPVMRRLLEMNYNLFYSRYALKDNKICIIFNSTYEASPPRKLYFSWRELATRADKQDDLLIDDFKNLKTIGNAHIIQIPEKEKEIKYKYFKLWIDKAISRINELNEDAVSGGISYLLLNTIYKIDYLIAPEGTLMTQLEKLSWEYFANDNKPFTEKNRKLKEDFIKLSELSKENFYEDIYKVTSTFGIANPAPHQAVIDLCNNNLKNVKWYLDNNYTDIALTIYEYIATYCLFTYGLPKPDIKLFHLMINIINQDYFTELNEGEILYDKNTNLFSTETINNKINEIIKAGKEQYPELNFDISSLKYDSLQNFLRTYLHSIEKLNYNL